MTQPTTPAVDLQGVTKRYGHVTALDGLTLQVEHGEVHGFLGPNGAGKSTAIRILLGILRHDEGHARILGGDPLEGRRRPAPASGLRPRRRGAVAEPHRW
jgi:ABC-type multidrug transport system ATPase subunit